jgi:REP element-mobilizing transposase RayT
VFLKVLEQTRKKYQFVVAGYVVMPEHVHLLIGEPKIEDPSRVMQVLKQRVSLQCRAKKRAAKQQLKTFSEELPPHSGSPDLMTSLLERKRSTLKS